MEISEFKTKIFQIDNIETKDNRIIIAGYASVFNVIDSHGDKIINGAFAGIDYKKVQFLWQHDHSLPIGKIISAYEDNYGLYFKAELILDIGKAQEAYKLIKNGVINSLSIGYQIIKARKDSICRIIEKLTLHEISLVTFPANSLALVTSLKETDLLNSIENAKSVLNKEKSS